MRKIKIAQVITRMDWGGSPDVLRLLCRKLDPDIYELKVFIGTTRHPSEKTRLFFEAFGPQITFIPALKREIDLGKDWLAFWKLFRIFNKEKFDVVHTHTAKAGALGRLAACLAGVPIIIHTPHGHNFYGYFNKFFSSAIILIEKFLSALTDKIMVLTRLERNDYLKFKAAEEKKIILINMGLELDKFVALDHQKIRSSLNIDPSDKLVGFVGRLDPIKGAQVFVRAAVSCLKADINARFILAGEGVLRRELEESVESAGYKGRIFFMGWREDVADVMSALDILVLPSLNEAAGLVLIEAQSLGVPVIASNVGGIPEMIDQGQTGILVPANDPEALASAIKELLSDPQRLQAMSAAGKSWVKSRFRAEDMTARIIDVYFQALKEKNVSL